MAENAPLPWRVITLLAFASFASAANLRVTDPLLAQIAHDFSTSVGVAAGIVAAFAISYGLLQAVYGPLADRVGKVRLVAAGSILAGLATALCAVAASLGMLSLGRFVAGAMAAAVIPLAIAWIGDAVPFAERQPVMARFLSGQMMGLVFGQAAGGFIGDHFGWRGAYLMLGLVHVAAGLALLVELRRGGPAATIGGPSRGAGLSSLASAGAILRTPWARVVLIAVGIEGAAMYGAFAYVGADLHRRYGLGFGLIGLILCGFGFGGLAYAWSVKPMLARLGEAGFAVAGGIVMALSFLALALIPGIAAAIVAVAALGFGYYLLHNTLQVQATQMAPEARGLAIALFASSLFISQSIGVAAAGPVVDAWGAKPVYVAAALVLAAVGAWFGARLKGNRG